MKKLILIMMMFISTSSIALSNVYFIDEPKEAASPKTQDVQLWLTLSAENKFHRWLTLKFDNELRLRSDVSEVGYIHSEIGLEVHPPRLSWFTFGFNGRVLLNPEKPKVLDAWKGGWELRPTLFANFQGSFIDLAKFSNCIKLEMHLNGEGWARWRIRNLSSASGKVWWKLDKSINLAVSNEFFLVVAGVNENRLRGGFEFWLSGHAGVSVYYQWTTRLAATLSSEELDPKPNLALKEEVDWAHSHVIGAKGLLRF